MSIIEQVMDVVEDAEPAIIVFTQEHAGDRTLYADVIVPRNYVRDEHGTHHRVADVDVESLAVMDRRGDWRHVRVDEIAAIERV